MKKYQYILLDWDGNLAKTLDIWLDATRVPLTNRDIYISDNQIVLQCWGRPFEGYAELGIKDIDTAVGEMDAYAKKFMPEVELYPDALFVLEQLKDVGKKIALVTTSLRENVIHLLEKYNMDHFFDAVIANEDTEQHKPHPEPLLTALEALGGNKEEAVMIGDSDKDIGAGENAGIDSILFFPKEHARFYDIAQLKELHPTFIIEDFREVTKIAQP